MVMGCIIYIYIYISHTHTCMHMPSFGFLPSFAFVPRPSLLFTFPPSLTFLVFWGGRKKRFRGQHEDKNQDVRGVLPFPVLPYSQIPVPNSHTLIPHTCIYMYMLYTVYVCLYMCVCACVYVYMYTYLYLYIHNTYVSSWCPPSIRVVGRPFSPAANIPLD
jgi:hypothetical protein